MPRKLLIIEDDADVRYLIRRLARRRQWEFHEAATAEDGLAKASDLGPDIILLDVELPDQQGWEVCRELKRMDALRRIPVMMISGKRIQPKEQAKGIEAGADDYLVKPFDLSELCLRIEGIWKARGA